jgi:hypothetical protein
MLMIPDVAPNHIAGYFVARGSHEAAVAPESASPQLPPQVGMLAKQLSGRDALLYLHDPGRRQPGRLSRPKNPVRSVITCSTRIGQRDYLS